MRLYFIWKNRSILEPTEHSENTEKEIVFHKIRPLRIHSRLLQFRMSTLRSHSQVLHTYIRPLHIYLRPLRIQTRPLYEQMMAL